jgi:hypothetical protein
MYWTFRWFYYTELITMIEEIEADRKKMLLIGETMTTTFAQDLKIRLRR